MSAIVRPSRRLALAVLLVPLSGCLPAFWPESDRGRAPRDGGDRLDPRVRRSDGGQDRGGLARKVVMGKEAPATLLSADGLRCQVSERRFREVSEGEKVWCAWRKS